MEQQNSGKQVCGAGDSRVVMNKADVIELLKSLEGIKRKLQALLK